MFRGKIFNIFEISEEKKFTEEQVCEGLHKYVDNIEEAIRFLMKNPGETLDGFIDGHYHSFWWEEE